MGDRKTILAVCTTALGDTLLCTPAIARLAERFRVEVLVHQRNLALFQGNPAVSRVIAYRNNQPWRWLLGLKLAGARYHRVLVMHANDDLKKLLPLLRYEEAANGQGWEDPGSRLTAVPIDPALHVIEKRLALAAWAGASKGFLHMSIYLTDDEREQGRQWLARQGEAPKGWVFMCPGAALKYKRWPAERFGALAARLLERDHRVAIMGSDGEADLADQVEAACGRQLTRALGLDLRLAGALLSRAELLVTNDTGPMHLAQAVGAPTLALFGPSDPVTIGPRRDPQAVLTAPPLHQPCRTKACQEPLCLEAITVEQAAQAAQGLLNRKDLAL